MAMATFNAATRVVTIEAEPLTPEAFAPFGKVLDENHFVLASNEFPFFANLVTLRPSTEDVTYVNRHHDHNQIFASIGGDPMVVIVADPRLPGDGFDPTQIRAFVTDGNTAIVFHVDTWHLAPRGVGNRTARALNVQATNNYVYTERIELADVGGYVVRIVT
jgi:ureidoglycolate hydrolase